MFKTASFENEIRQSMEKTLVANQNESTHGFKRIAQAIDYLNQAAEIFEQAGMAESAKETSQVLHSLAMENFSLADLAGLEDKDLHNLLEMSTPNQLLQLAKKVDNVASERSTFGDEVRKSMKDHDLSDPEVRKGFVSKLKSALKLVKFFA